MSETLERVDPALLLAHAEDAIRALLDPDLTGCSDAETVAFVQHRQRLRNLLAAGEHAAILEIERRGIPAAQGARTTGGFLAHVLQLDPRETAGRVRAAHACGRRWTMTGDRLDPALPRLAAAQADGVVPERSVAVIGACVAKLPDAAVEHIPRVEADLVQIACRKSPTFLATCAQRVNYLYDQDGAFNDLEQRRRHRTLTLNSRIDGSATLTGQVTAELAELLQVAFDSLAAPKPETGGIKDPRTAGQRRHDALCEVLHRVLRSGTLPDAGGVTSTVILTMSIADYEQRTGFTFTAHGAQVPVTEALRWGGGDSRFLAVVLDSVKGIVAFGECHRLFTERERLAMIARDRGCSAPDCPAPPGWCQAHHVTEWQTSRRTSVDDGALTCPWHHRELDRPGGWRVTMRDGHPVWTPPTTTGWT